MNNCNCGIVGSIKSKYELTGNIMETILVGLSAYEVAVKNGYEGTEEEWLNSLSVHVEVVSDKEHEYILSITTSDGTFLTPNLKPILIKGVDYLTPKEVEELVTEVTQDVIKNIDSMYQRKEEGKSLVLDTEIERLATLKNYDDEWIHDALEEKANVEHTHKVVDITDFPQSLPASDVYDWAKQPQKPTYDKTDVGLGNVDNTSDKDKPLSDEMISALDDIGKILDDKAYTKDLEDHVNNNVVHISNSERTKWNNKSNVIANPSTTGTVTELTTIKIDNSVYKISGTTSDVEQRLNNLEEEMLTKAEDSQLKEHVEDENVHVNPNDKQRWDNKSDFSGKYEDLIDKPTKETENIDFSNIFGGN